MRLTLDDKLPNYARCVHKLGNAMQTQPEVEVKLLFFAKSKELVGKKEERFTTESVIQTKQLLRNIVKAHPG